MSKIGIVEKILINFNLLTAWDWISAIELLEMAQSAGVEPATTWFVVKYSIQLSYDCAYENFITIKPVTVKAKIQ